MAKVGFITLGCPKNEADTARMRALIASSSYELASQVEDADIAIVNTCGFITTATEESLECIFDLAREWLPVGENRHLVVVGCMTSRYGSQLTDEMPEVSLFLSVSEEADLLDHLDVLTGAVSRRSAVDIKRTAEGPSEYVMIADGCDKKCSFCTIPSIRGSYRSRSLAEIIDEVCALVATGAREIILIAQDTSRYGYDLDEEVTLSTLIDTLSAVDGLQWLRVMYVQPEGLTDELLDAMRRNEKVVPYFEIPMQHASKRILRDMGRGGDGESFFERITQIRRLFPDAVIRTTLIAGYPGETEAEFQELVEFVERAHFDYVGVFAYSPEEGTVAADRDEQIPEDVRIRRAQIVRDVAEEISFERGEGWIGKEIEVLIEGVDEDDEWYGRFYGQAPEIDGVVRLTPSKDVQPESGMIVRVEVEDTFLFDLEGTIR